MEVNESGQSLQVSSPYEILLESRPGKKRSFSRCRSNQDRALAREFTAAETGRSEPAALIAVADGVSRCPDGGAVADWIIYEKLNTEPLFWDPTMVLGEQLRTRILEFHREFIKRFQDDILMLESGCTLAAALLYGSRAYALWSGDSPIYHLEAREEGFSAHELIIPDREPLSGALTDCFSGVTPFCLNHRVIHLAPGDIVIAASDGIVSSGKHLADSIAKDGFSAAWIESICQESFDSPNSDDMSIVAARWLGPS